MCDPVSAGMFAINTVGAIGEHQTKKAGVAARNRQRLKQHQYENQNYINEVKLDNAQYFNDVAEYEIEKEQVFSAMVNQWQQVDEQLDQMFANTSFKLQDEMIKMYEKEYAGTQTGASAARLAASSAKKKGFAMAKEINTLIMAQDDAALKKEGAHIDASTKLDKLYDKVRFPPVHGHTPVPPELEAMPSSAGLMLDIAGSALQSYGFSKLTKPKPTGMKEYKGFSDWELGTAVPEIPTLSDGTTDWSKAWSTD